MMIKLADYVFKFLELHKVNHVFMLSGGSSMHLDDALGKSKKVKYIPCHHEQACAMAAEAYSKYTGKIGVVLVTSGPGATNTITGVTGAFVDSNPCLIISGQAKLKQTVYNCSTAQLRQFGVQEINIIPIVESITKYAVTVTEPKKIRYHLEKALYLAETGRPGPVWIDIPLDIQTAYIDENELYKFDKSELEEGYNTNPVEKEVEYVLELIQKSSRPVVIAGHGIRLSRATDELLDFVLRFKIPVVTPFLGIDVIHSDSENYIGRTGTKGTRAGNFAMQNADLIISIGSRLSVSTIGHEYNLFAREAIKVVVDIDPNEHKKGTIKIDKFINSDAKMFINSLMDISKDINIKTFDLWLEKCNGWKNKYPVCLPEYAQIKEGVSYYYFVDRLTRKLNSDTSIISDAGSSFYVVSQAIHVKKNQRYITSGGLATMGFNLPAAIGVSFGDEKKNVVTITGEGSFQQNIQELQTIKHFNLPIKIFVVCNKGYYSIRQTQKKYFNSNFVGEGIESGVSFPDSEKIALAYGIKYYKITNNDDLDKTLEEVMECNGPVICEVNSLEDQAIIPTVSSAINKNGIMVSKPLEDMFPFLDRDEFKKEMIIKIVEE